jgi:AraC family transcriptional regulator
MEGNTASHQAFIGSTVVHSLATKAGKVSLMQYSWPTAPVDDWTSKFWIIELALSQRRSAWAAFSNRALNRVPLGRAIMIPAGEHVHSGCDSGRGASIVCEIHPKIISSLSGDCPRWSSKMLRAGLNLDCVDTIWLLAKLQRELIHPCLTSHVVVESLTLALTANALRSLGPIAADSDNCSGGITAWRMRRILDRIYADLPAPGLIELAEAADLSVRHLSRGFKHETGKTVAQFVRKITYERAYRMLGEDEKSIEDIASALGFSNSSSFGAAFRRITGLRPSDVERRCTPIN